MSAVSLSEIAAFLDDTLSIATSPDYPGAFNGIQVECTGAIQRVAVAVDASLQTIQGAIDAGANLLIIHHGLFWSGVQPLRGRFYERMRQLIMNDVAVYSAHLPLDSHPTLGNNALLARALGLEPSAGFASFQGKSIGVSGETDVATNSLIERARAIATEANGSVVVANPGDNRRTKRWAICTGAGASSDTLREAAAANVDIIITGEGPHHTAVEAMELGITVIYAGHYATETFGVKALGAELEKHFGLPWSFIHRPSGL